MLMSCFPFRMLFVGILMGRHGVNHAVPKRGGIVDRSARIVTSSRSRSAKLASFCHYPMLLVLPSHGPDRVNAFEKCSKACDTSRARRRAPASDAEMLPAGGPRFRIRTAAIAQWRAYLC